MLEEKQYIYNGARITRVTGASEMIGRVEVTTAGEIKSIAVRAENVGSVGNFVFNLRKNSAPLLSGSDKLTVNSGAKRAEKTDADFDTISVVKGDLLSFALDEVGAGGILGDIIFTIVIDDGESSGGAVDSVNAQTGTVVIDADDISDSGTAHKFATAAEKTKLGFVSVTQAVDLDQIETDTATNNGKTSNATHTGDVTGATALTIDKTAITGKTNAAADAADYILISDTSDSGNLKKALISSLPGGGSGTSADIQPFTTSGTWTKPAGAKLVEVFLVGGGGGGGSGKKNAAGSQRGGGGGGAGSAPVLFTFPASILGSTETVTIGAAGTGGASQTTNGGNGSAGTAGGDTTFGTWATAKGGNPGSGAATTNGGTNGNGVTGLPTDYNSGSGATGGAGSAPTSAASTKLAPSGGGGGGSITTGNVANAGSAGGQIGGSSSTTSGILLLSASSGGATSTNGTAGTNAPTNSFIGGSGGGGGGASTTGNAGNGGGGGFPGGGGGGGGAAVDSVGNSGTGGGGGAGYALIITYF